ncbi:MAG: lipid A biosynthesis acyltransferase [Pseudomonadota bacterium]
MTSHFQWQEHRERGNTFALRALRFAAMKLGRRVIRLVLYPVALYFALTSGATRRVSREYLARVLPQPPRFRDVLRHIFSFASISLDRVFLLTNGYPFKVTDHYDAGCLELARQRGALLFLSHFGSFEVMRIGAVKRHELPLRIVLDVNIGRRFMAALSELNPEVAAGIIDSSNRGVDLILKVREALDARSIVGLMVDRTRAGDRTVTVNFLGGTAEFPAGPWLMAAALKVPVMLVFGIWRGGDRYEAHVQLLSEKIELPRANREAELSRLVQEYADRLATQVRRAPYNWLNFFDFWAR